MIEEQLVNFLLSQKEITDLVDDRIYPMHRCENMTFPGITYLRISNSTKSRSRTSANKAPVYQISCWAKSFKQARQLSDAVIEIFDNYSGSMGNIDFVSFHENDRDIYEPGVGLYHIPVDIEINYDKEKIIL